MMMMHLLVQAGKSLILLDLAPLSRPNLLDSELATLAQSAQTTAVACVVVVVPAALQKVVRPVRCRVAGRKRCGAAAPVDYDDDAHLLVRQM